MQGYRMDAGDIQVDVELQEYVMEVDCMRAENENMLVVCDMQDVKKYVAE